MSLNSHDKTILGILAFAILLIVIGPLLTIWALNTLFPILAIPYSLDTWAAAVLLGMFVRGERLVSTSSKK